MSQNIKKIDLDSIKGKINAKLRGLGVNNFSIGEEIIGPVVTGYPLNLGFATSIKAILNKSEDIALACGVDFVDIRRIEDKVIIFIPNENRKIVDFKDALYWMMKDEKVQEMKIPIILGQDFYGNNSAIDLFTQPHILIAGSTGSGKSIFESAIIAALTMLKTPEELHLYIVDPKRVDLTLFENLPHIKKMVREPFDWRDMMEYLYAETQNRQKFFETKKVRNIAEFNVKNTKKMAYKVLIIDELADLMEKSKSVGVEVQSDLLRLIQVCRAAGIHIIACTQRTSTNVVTGDIKANFPTRISLRLPSWVDSRTILDEKGAENLLGKGDMLLKSPDKDNLQRFHAPFVKMEDIQYVLDNREEIKEMIGVM